MKRKPPDQAPESGDQDPAQAGSAEVGRPAGKTTTGRRRPAANAREAQEPDPAPEKQADGDGDGATLGGQGEETSPTSPAPGPEDATAETRAAERLAKEERPTPNDDARKTDAEGAAERTRASSPGAQPTATPRPERRTERTPQETSADDESVSDREPQNPTRPATSTPRELPTPPAPRAARGGHPPQQHRAPMGEHALAHRERKSCPERFLIIKTLR